MEQIKVHDRPVRVREGPVCCLSLKGLLTSTLRNTFTGEGEEAAALTKEVRINESRSVRYGINRNHLYIYDTRYNEYVTRFIMI